MNHFRSPKNNKIFPKQIAQKLYNNQQIIRKWQWVTQKKKKTRVVESAREN